MAETSVGLRAVNLTGGPGGFEGLRRNYVYGGKEPYKGPADSAIGLEESKRRNPIPVKREPFKRVYSRTNPAPCGTDPAYHRHIKNKETPDDDCRRAHSDHCTKKSRQRRRAEAQARAGRPQ